MQVTEFSSVNFRNLRNINIKPSPKTNVIIGQNGQGKTNLIEAIWLFTGAKSFRTSKDINLININEESAKNKMLFTSFGTQNDAEILIKEKRSVFLNGKKLNSPSMIAGTFNAVVFSPDDLSLIKRGPSERRKFIDTAIGQIYPKYIEILRKYTKAVIQRNEIIKEYKYDKSIEIMLDVFEDEISKYGEEIIKYRRKYIDKLNNYFPSIYYELSDKKEKISAFYISNSNENLSSLLKEKRKEDSYSGVTSAGPHRDDVNFNINDISAKNFGSQGQQRSIVLSLKLSQADVNKEICGEYPVCLFDDVLSELDNKRQEYILKSIEKMQVFLTCCDTENIKNIDDIKVFRCENGEIV